MGRTLHYNIDDNLFKKIDSEEKAYILGFVASDGYISKEGKIIISIHIKDLDILKKIRDFICKEIPIKINGDFCKLLVARKQIAIDMSNHLKIPFGIAKSFIVKFPNINKKYHKHFIRGFFDGDGYILRNLERRNWFLSSITSASKSILEHIQQYTENGKLYKHSSKEAYVLRYYSNYGIKFIDYLYKDSKIYMDRKYNLYEIWKKEFKDSNFYKKHKKINE